MNIEENVIDNIMDFHGDIDKMLPEGYFPKSINNCLNIDNWRLLWKSGKRKQRKNLSFKYYNRYWYKENMESF